MVMAGQKKKNTAELLQQFNGRLLYHILPIQMSINQYYERQFQEADLALERQKVTKRLAALERKEGANNADANA